MNERDFERMMARASGDVKKLNEKETAKAGKARKRSTLERKFAYYWDSFTPVVPLEEEYVFDESEAQRRWRFDLAHPATRIAVELEGGIYSQGRHNRAKGYKEDAEKYTKAALQGWKVLRYTTGQVTLQAAKEVYHAITGNEPATTIEQAASAAEKAAGAGKPARPVGGRRTGKARKKGRA